jgi:hypothetical protein
MFGCTFGGLAVMLPSAILRTSEAISGPGEKSLQPKSVCSLRWQVYNH